MSVIKDIRNFFSYKKIVKKNRVNLKDKFNLRIDNADRLYTVLNIPSDLEEPYNLRKGDIDTIAQTYIREYIASLSENLNSIGLAEMYDFYEPIKKVDKYSYLIIIGYKQLDSVDINKLIYRRIVPIISIVAIISLFIFLFRV